MTWGRNQVDIQETFVVRMSSGEPGWESSSQAFLLNHTHSLSLSIFPSPNCFFDKRKYRMTFLMVKERGKKKKRLVRNQFNEKQKLPIQSHLICAKFCVKCEGELSEMTLAYLSRPICCFLITSVISGHSGCLDFSETCQRHSCLRAFARVWCDLP